MNYSIEIIRIVAVILITFTHTRHSIESGIPFFFFEDLPRIGTLLLSIASGYLFFKVSTKKKTFLANKIKTLLIPFLIANISVLLLVYSCWYFFDLNFLNRLNFDSEIIKDGIFALSRPPINPPTYFIRDIFVIFLFIELIKNKNYWTLLFIIPLLFFGQLLIRYDIAFLFIIGVLLSKYETFIVKNMKTLFFTVLFITLISIIFTDIETYRYPVSFLLFILMMNVSVSFFNVGAFSYLLHLYHSPIIVVAYPLINGFVENQVLSVLLQVFISIVCVYILFLLTRKFKKLRILCGGK